MLEQSATSQVLIGESYVGEGGEGAHINTVLGDRHGPGGAAWATALAGQVGVPAELSALVEQVHRRGRAQYADIGGEMLPLGLYEDLTRTPLRLPPPASG